MKFAGLVAIGLASLVSASLQPRATDAVDHLVDGFSPKPTSLPYDLSRVLDPDLQVCGYIAGSPQGALTCGAERPCGFNDAQSWFGCCSSYTTSGTVTAPVGCTKALSCVPFSSISACTGACASNTLVTRCTNSASGFCATLVLSTTQLYTNYLCVSSSLPPVVVLGTTTGPAGSSRTPSGSFLLSANSTSNPFTRASSASTASTTSTSSSSSRSSASAGGAMSTGAPLMVLAGGAMLALL